MIELIGPVPMVADSTWAIVTLAGAILTVLGVVFGGLMRNSKSSPEVRDAQVRGWDLLTGNLTKEVERVSVQIEKLQGADREKTAQIAALQAQVASLTLLNGWLRRYMTKLLVFIRSIDHEPPEPDEPEPPL